MIGRRLAPALLLLLAVPGRGGAQATPLLPPDDPAYQDLDRLVAWGLVDTVLAGQRPWSVRQAEALADQARGNLGRLEGDPALAATAASLVGRVGPRLARLRGEDPGGSSPGPLRGGRLDLGWTDSPWRGIPPNVVSETSARLNPLLAYDGGREIVTGTTAGLELDLGGTLGERVAWAAEVRGQIDRERSGGGMRVRDPSLRTLYARAVLGNAAVTVGRAPVVWGHGPRGGLLLSTNPRPLLLAAVATEDPVTLPWILEWLGPSRHQLFWADLGTEGRAFPHAFLINVRSSFQPLEHVELGIGLLNQQGGEGAPGATVLERIADVLVIPDLFVTDRDFLFSNKLIQLDALVRFPSARGLEVWAEAVLDDFDVRRLGSIVTDDAGYRLGVRVSRLDRAGRAALTLEGQRTGVRFYGHNTFSGGVTVDRRILGSELGTDGRGVYARLDWMAGIGDDLSLEAAWERRSNDQYHLELDETPRGFRTTESRPEETRWRWMASWTRRERPAGGWWVGGRLGWEAARSFGFVEGADRSSWLVRVVAGWEG